MYLECDDPYSDGFTSASLHKSISSLITDITQSINHTPYISLRHRPIAVSIETKTISRSEEEARVQLGIWVTAQVERIRSLIIQLSSNATTTRRNEANITSRELPDRAATLAHMVFPLIYVQSPHWVVLFARPSLSPLVDKRIVSPSRCKP